MTRKQKIQLSKNALKVLKERFLLRDDSGKVIETPEQMFWRVANNVARADRKYGANVKQAARRFYDLMVRLDFLPNSPTLMNAGTRLQQLAACFVLPVKDDMAGIFDAVKQTALIQQTGGGTGFNFSDLRPKDDLVSSTKRSASGPVSFMRVFDETTNAIKQAGRRRGANMAILNVDHPDILEFISSKKEEGAFANFNISVGATDRFMEAVLKNRKYDLVNPRTSKVVEQLPARKVFDAIVRRAWQNGEPGLVFLDRIERDNPTPKMGKISATNPCGEQPLLAFEACNLGSINVNNFVEDRDIDWERLRGVVHEAVHFLDNVIGVSDYKIDLIKKIVHANRKIGLGIMGFAHLLFRLKIPYNSEKALRMAEKLMAFIQQEAKGASVELGRKRGSFPGFARSRLAKRYKTMRNATVTTIAPTGTIGMVAETSSGIEPLFALAYVKQVLDGKKLFYKDQYFEEEIRRRGLYSPILMRKIAKTGSAQDVRGIPLDIKRIFVVSRDISPEWHVRMQAAFQKYTDNAVSKTINFSYSATAHDVRKAYLLAYKLGCKGITIYRDTSRKIQVLRRLEIGI